jgi:hypothetical protein
METPYDVKAWAAETTSGRQVFNYNYRLFGRELRGWELLKAVPMQEGRGVTEKVYLWHPKADGERDMIRISIAEHDHWRSAQKRLHQELSHSMRPDIPRGTGKLGELGDVNYVGRDPQSDVPAAITFSRGNVCVSVSSVGERNVDVSDIAASLDRALSKPPAKADLAKGRVRVRAPKTAIVKAGEPYVVIENLQETARRGEWLKIIVPVGELTRKGDALVYVSPQSGQQQIRIYAVHGN